MDDAAGDPPVVTKRCSSCFEPILAQAQKCKHCGSYQGHWRGLHLSSSILALIVAMLSILTVLVPVIAEVREGHRSNLLLSFQRYQDGIIYLIATNSGDRAGTIGGANLRASTSRINWNIEGLVASESSPFVGPGASQLVTFDIGKENREELKALDGLCSDDGKLRGIAEVSATQFDGTTKKFSFAFDLRSQTDALDEIFSAKPATGYFPRSNCPH